MSSVPFNNAIYRGINNSAAPPRRTARFANNANVAEFSIGNAPSMIGRRGRLATAINNGNTRGRYTYLIPRNNTRKAFINSMRRLNTSVNNASTRSASRRNNPLGGIFSRYMPPRRMTTNQAKTRANRRARKQAANR